MVQTFDRLETGSEVVLGRQSKRERRVLERSAGRQSRRGKVLLGDWCHEYNRERTLSALRRQTPAKLAGVCVESFETALETISSTSGSIGTGSTIAPLCKFVSSMLVAVMLIGENLSPLT